jgi:hypothetical protein
MQVRSLPDVRVLTAFGTYGVSLAPGQRVEVQVEVTPRSYGIICTMLMLDFGGPLRLGPPCAGCSLVHTIVCIARGVLDLAFNETGGPMELCAICLSCTTVGQTCGMIPQRSA